MQLSAIWHCSRGSAGRAASLTSSGPGSGVFAVATCTGGGSCGGTCGKSGSAATTIGFGSSGTAVVPAVVSVTDSAAVATASLASAALSFAASCGASANAVSGTIDGAARASISGAPDFSTPAVAKAGCLATAQLAGTSVAYSIDVTVIIRRGSMILSSPKDPSDHAAQSSPRRDCFLRRAANISTGVTRMQRAGKPLPRHVFPFGTKELPAKATPTLLEQARLRRDRLHQCRLLSLS